MCLLFFFTAQHLISTSYTISSKKTISGEVDKDINFFVTSIPVFVSYIKSRRPTLLPLKGTKIEEQEHELQNLNSAIAAKVMGFPKKTCNGGVFVSMIETEDIKF